MKKRVREIEMRLLQPVGDADRLGALLEMGAHHADEGHERDGLRAAREALDMAREAHDLRASGRALALAARCHFQKGDALAAVASGLDALEALGADDRITQAHVLRVMALALESFDDAGHAEDAAAQAARLSLGCEATEAATRETYGRILARRGRGHAAREQLRRAAEIFKRIGDRHDLKRVTAAVADTYRGQGNDAQRMGRDDVARLQWRHAARVYRTALAFSRHAGHDAAILAGLAECESALRDPDAAYEHAALAVTLSEEVQDNATLARARLWESHALQAMSRLQAAERACSHAVAAADAARDEPLLVACLRAHARLNDLLGRFQNGADLEDRARRVAERRRAETARLRAELAPLIDGRRIHSGA